MEDIEDLRPADSRPSADSVGALGSEQYDSNKALIFPQKKTDVKQQLDTQKISSCIPGTQRVWIKTQGCSHNFSDSEYMAGILSNYGFRIVDDAEEADLWLLNSCTVKDPSQAAFMNYVNKAKDRQLPVVVAGCVSQADRKLPGLEDVSVVGVTQIDRVVEAVEQTLQGNTVKMLAKKKLPRLDLPKLRRNPLVEIIPLSTGCLGACTYCKTRHARGKLGSYELEAIVRRAKAAIYGYDDIEGASESGREADTARGVAEIWLTSEDTGAYGRDIGTNIGALLRELSAILPSPDEPRFSNGVARRGVMLRLGMTNPPYILEHLEIVAEVMKHPQVYAFLHVPVQAGSNAVLDRMNREYSVEDFCRVVDYLQEAVPGGVTIATDIICGFPGETEEDFQQTLDLIAKYQFAIVNISQFYPRPGTPAAKMQRVKTQVVKERSRRLTRLFESFQPYNQMLGDTVRVWFDIETNLAKQPISDVDRNGEKEMTIFRQSVGHTKRYVKVVVDHNETLPGSCQLVRIIRCCRFHVEGLVIAEVYPGRVPSHGSKRPESTAKTKALTTSSGDNGVSSRLANWRQNYFYGTNQKKEQADDSFFASHSGTLSLMLLASGVSIAIASILAMKWRQH